MNRFEGHIPGTELSELKNLQSLKLYSNKLIGRYSCRVDGINQFRRAFIRKQFFNGYHSGQYQCALSKLQKLSLMDNELVG